jgi:mevalonate kinase
MSSSNFGYGKIILLGEHFVVHGLPAVAVALDLKTYTDLQENDFQNDYLILVDNRPKAPGFVPSKLVQYRLICENILNFLKIKQKKLTVTLTGNLPVTCGGIGSSAAFAVSFARAISSKFNLNLSNDEINLAAFVGEQAVHGTPSGVDNTAAVFGGVIKFCNNQNFMPALSYSKVQIKKSIEIVIIDSGKVTDTKQVILAVRDFMQKNPDETEIIFEQYNDIFNAGFNALDNNNLEKLGHNMNENHKLLQALGVSSPELNAITNKACELGALGAKLTGTGCGGLVIALTPGKDLQDLIAGYFEKSGYFVIKSKINA